MTAKASNTSKLFLGFYLNIASNNIGSKNIFNKEYPQPVYNLFNIFECSLCLEIIFQTIYGVIKQSELFN